MNNFRDTTNNMKKIIWAAVLFLPFTAFSQQDSTLKVSGGYKDTTSTKAKLFKKFMEAGTINSAAMYMDAFRAKYPSAKSEWNYRPDIFYAVFADKSAEKKQWKTYDYYVGKLTKKEAIEEDYNKAIDLLKSGQKTPRAEFMALRALKLYEKTNKVKPVTKEADSVNMSNSSFNLHDNMMELYARLTYASKHYQQGLPYAKKLAEKLPAVDVQTYELYLKFLSKTADPRFAMSAIEAHYRLGDVEDDELRHVLDGLYYKVHKSSKGFDGYYNSLTAYLITAAKKKLYKEKISKEAPNFTLLNLKGETVTLASLKGKTVVIDFWATWCGPCKRSFPGMQQLINKYKSNDKVVFLFLNTLENFKTDEARKKSINGFLTANHFNFNVLLDTGSGDNYTVVKAYGVDGIPTKFVIGPDGQINFIDVGYSGSDEKLMIDISGMIDLTM